MSNTDALPELTRFSFFCDWDGGGPAQHEIDSLGDWVAFSDACAALAAQARLHEVAIARLQGRIDGMQTNENALRAERDALKADAAALDWIECRAMNGQIQAARSIMGTGYEIAVIERGGPMTVTVELGTLRQALASRAARTGGKG